MIAVESACRCHEALETPHPQLLPQNQVNMVFLSSPLSGPGLYRTSAGAW